MQELIIEFLFGNGQVSQGLAPLAIAGIAQGVSSLIGAFSAGKQKRAARKAAQRYEQDLSRLEASRQNITNPYANMADVNTSITNPFQNLQVATQAAEMQAAETDISLAGTLDTLRATGMGAGGATALAQAAARSKQGIAASIEQQEARNAQLRAQGEQAMQQFNVQSELDKQRLIGSGELQRMSMQEQREVAQLDRTSDLMQQQQMIEQQARQAQNQAIGSLIGSAASIGLSAFGGSKVPAGGSGAANALTNASSTLPINFKTGAATGLTSSFASQYGNPLSSMNFKYGN
jgi:hypothetical protein